MFLSVYTSNILNFAGVCYERVHFNIFVYCSSFDRSAVSLSNLKIILKLRLIRSITDRLCCIVVKEIKIFFNLT